MQILRWPWKSETALYLCRFTENVMGICQISLNVLCEHVQQVVPWETARIWGCYYEPFGLYMTKERAVFAFSAQSEVCFRWMLNS